MAWGLVANWLPERLWEVILACSGLWWPNVTQRDSGGLFWLVLGSVGQMASREVLGTHFGLFWALVANVSQKASEIYFGEFWVLLTNWHPERFWEFILACSGP